jgi:hypothetical protein
MKKPVYLYAKNGLVTLKIGRFPFRQVIRWNIYNGEDSANLYAFMNSLRIAASKGAKTKASKK